MKLNERTITYDTQLENQFWREVTPFLKSAHICICHIFVFMQDWLVEALRERMKYFRRNKSNIQCSMSESKRAMQKNPLKQQMPHISTLPHTMDSVGEDEASHDRHVKLLALEWRKSKPNRHAIGELMRRTFGVRRKNILSSPASLDCLLKSYPPLQQYGEVCD